MNKCFKENNDLKIKLSTLIKHNKILFENFYDDIKLLNIVLHGNAHKKVTSIHKLINIMRFTTKNIKIYVKKNKILTIIHIILIFLAYIIIKNNANKTYINISKIYLNIIIIIFSMAFLNLNSSFFTINFVLTLMEKNFYLLFNGKSTYIGEKIKKEKVTLIHKEKTRKITLLHVKNNNYIRMNIIDKEFPQKSLLNEISLYRGKYILLSEFQTYMTNIFQYKSEYTIQNVQIQKKDKTIIPTREVGWITLK